MAAAAAAAAAARRCGASSASGVAAAGAAARRAIALDMDGTTLTSRHALTPRTIESIRRADASGVQVIVATGRPALSLQPYIDELALPRAVPAVCFNGACALMLGAGAAVAAGEREVLFSEGLSPAAAEQVLSLCDRAGWCASYCRPGGTAAAPRTAEHERLLANFESLEGIKQQRLTELAPLVAAGELPLKVVAMAEDPEAAAAEARAALPEGLVHVIAAEMHIEFLSPAVNKGKSLARLCREALALPLEEVVAFGDNHNDVEMLSFVGEGIAMRNAKDSTKEAANRESQWTNDEEGVAREIEAMLDGGSLKPRSRA